MTDNFIRITHSNFLNDIESSCEVLEFDAVDPTQYTYIKLKTALENNSERNTRLN